MADVQATYPTKRMPRTSMDSSTSSVHALFIMDTMAWASAGGMSSAELSRRWGCPTLWAISVPALPRALVIVGLEGNIVIPRDHDFVCVGQAVEPRHRFLDAFAAPDVREVAGVEQDVTF